MLTKAVDTHHGGVAVLVIDQRGDGTHTDAQGSDEDKSIELCPTVTYILTIDDFGTELTLQGVGYLLAGLIDLYNCYLLHFSMVIG